MNLPSKSFAWAQNFNLHELGYRWNSPQWTHAIPNEAKRKWRRSRSLAWVIIWLVVWFSPKLLAAYRTRRFGKSAELSIRNASFVHPLSPRHTREKASKVCQLDLQICLNTDSSVSPSDTVRRRLTCRRDSWWEAHELTIKKYRTQSWNLIPNYVKGRYSDHRDDR